MISDSYSYSTQTTTNIPYEIAFWTASPQITVHQVTVTNNIGKADIVTVNGLGTGNTVKVYTAAKGGSLPATARATAQNFFNGNW